MELTIYMYTSSRASIIINIVFSGEPLNLYRAQHRCSANCYSSFFERKTILLFLFVL